MALSAEITLNAPLRIRIIPFHHFPGAVNMRLDNFFSRISNKESDAILRFYGWSPYCISIGRHQSSQILDLRKISDSGYHAVRRPTGGRAIFHASELTYSIVVPKIGIKHQDLYRFVHRIIATALQQLGYEVQITSGLEPLPKLVQTAADFPCFTRSAESEIQYAGRKLVGSAQKLYKNSILQHGSILMNYDHQSLSGFLKGSIEERKAVAYELSRKTISLKEILKIDITPEKIMTTVVKQLESMADISVYFEDISDREFDKSTIYEIPL